MSDLFNEQEIAEIKELLDIHPHRDVLIVLANRESDRQTVREWLSEWRKNISYWLFGLVALFGAWKAVEPVLGPLIDKLF